MAGNDFSAKVSEITTLLQQLDRAIENTDYRLSNIGSSGGQSNALLNQLRNIRYEVESLNGLELRLNVSTTGLDKVSNIEASVRRLATALDSINVSSIAATATALRQMINDFDRIGETDYNTQGLDKITMQLKETAKSADTTAKSIERIDLSLISLAGKSVGDLGFSALETKIQSVRAEIAETMKDLRALDRQGPLKDLLSGAKLGTVDNEGTYTRRGEKTRKPREYQGAPPVETDDLFPEEPSFSRST